MGAALGVFGLERGGVSVVGGEGSFDARGLRTHAYARSDALVGWLFWSPRARHAFHPDPTHPPTTYQPPLASARASAVVA